jgi:hypothetical protein
VTAGKGLSLAGSYRVTHCKQGILNDNWQRVVISGNSSYRVTPYKQGILSDSWQRVVIGGKLQSYRIIHYKQVTAGKGLSLAGNYRGRHHNQGILSDCWQRVVISGILQGYTLQTRNPEWQLAKGFH